MTRAALTALLAPVLLAGADTGPDPAQLACRPGGFVLGQFGNVEARPKAGASFSVLFDAANYQANNFDAALRAAMTSWSTVNGSAWQYRFGGFSALLPSGRDGQMTVIRGGRSFPAGVLAATLISYISVTGEIIDSDVFFNPAHTFSTAPERGEFDFQSVALHELGHGLGLDHNDACLPAPTVMHSTIGAAERMRELFPAEHEGARYLYPGSGGGGGGGAGGGGGGILAVSPSSLLFTGITGGSVPPPRTLSVSGGLGAWSAEASTSSGGNWLRLEPRSGVLPVVMEVSVQTRGLEPGAYLGRIRITSGEAEREVAVTLNLQAPPTNLLQASPEALSFEVLRGAATVSRDLQLTGTSGLNWLATAATNSGGGWLRPFPESGRLPAVLTVFVSPGGLGAQVYSGAITITAAGITREIPVYVEVADQSRLVPQPAQLSFTAAAGSSDLACSTLRLAGFAGAALDWSASLSAPWLAMNPGLGRSPTTIDVCTDPAGLAIGDYSGQIALTATAFGSRQNVPVLLTVAPPVVVHEGGIVNAASFAPNQAVTTGEIISLFGSNLASETAQAAGFPLPSELGGSRVLIGNVPARLLYVSPGQINLVTPSAAGAALQVFNGPLAGRPVALPFASQSPGVFTLLGNGAGAGAITHADFSPVTRAAPLQAGEPLLIYLTGLGPLDPPVPDGAPAPSDPLSRAINPARVLVDGQEAEVLYAGAAPGFAGLQLVVANAPGSLARRFPEVTVEVGGMLSNRVTAGGPSLLDVSPASVRAGAEASLTLRGLNFPPGSGLQVAGQNLPAAVTGGPLQTLTVTVPAGLLSTPGPFPLAVVDTAAPAELPSNSVTLTVLP
jgi:uncharacterized protein (TIGR03437 family)